MNTIYREVRVEKEKGQVLPWPSCKAVTWTGDWPISQNSTSAEEPNVEGSYLCCETFRQIIRSQIRQWVLQKNRQFLRPAVERSPTEKRSTKAGSQEPEENHKKIPKVPKSPSKPASPKQGAVEGTVVTETLLPLSASQKTRTRSIRLPSRFIDFDMKR